ncbi:hypothetical protein COL516b_003931 [Colletotrichum fioriniae]|nr:uncharacterized protein COL516b_003931 [Colletotrichum fioriniae]KAJ0307956.1 hypothetical protein COL516b_003931 [Colletotrichum fioriniae]
MEAARSFIRECVSAGKPTLIVPDKDADGLTSGVILERTLVLLGLDPSLITAYLPPKGHNIHDEASRAEMTSLKPTYIFILDQGSRSSPPLIDDPHRGLHKSVREACDWLCVMGTHGDLGNTLKWEPPFPDMKFTFKTYTKKALNDAVSLINAPRRTASYDVPSAWKALRASNSPKELLSNRSLLAARAEVNAEVERCTHTPPKFSADGRIAVFRINSKAQVHPVIATRWAGHLSSSKLEVVLVANEGYLPDMVNFSCRVPRCARAKEPPVNIIEVLQNVAARAEDTTLRERLGDSFARGHKEASGGIVPKDEFEELMAVLEIGKIVERESPKKGQKPGQANTLLNYFGKSEI